MDTVKQLNVAGLSLEIAGVLLIAVSDYLTRKKRQNLMQSRQPIYRDLRSDS